MTLIQKWGTFMVDKSFSYYDAIKLSEDKNIWEPCFKSIARNYLVAFSINFKNLEEWTIKIKNEDESIKNKSKLAQKINSYYQVFLALNPQVNGDLEVNENIINNFYEIKDLKEIEEYEVIESQLNLKKYEFSQGNFVTLDKLKNVTINFYKNVQFRREFFENAISLWKSQESLDNIGINEMLPPKSAMVSQRLS